jgi:hypothetical protein
VGFYVFYLLIFLIIGAICAIVLAHGAQDFEQGLLVVLGNPLFFVILIFMTCGLSVCILRAKKLYKNPLYILLVLVTAVITFMGGLLVGLIPVAFLTTRKNHE